MPQQVISLKKFGGLYYNPHQEDIPLEASAYSVNVDPSAPYGRLRGIPDKGSSYTANSVAIPDVYQADWIKYERADVSLGIDNATNANPIVITTASAHNLVSGKSVNVLDASAA